MKECIYCFCEERWGNTAPKRGGLHGRIKALISFFFSFISVKSVIKEFLMGEKSSTVGFPTAWIKTYINLTAL